MTELTDLTATALLEGYRAHDIDPVDALEACVVAMVSDNNALHAVVTVNDEAARIAAVRSSRRWRDGSARPLEGVPFAVKDIIETAGVLTAAGSPMFADHVPTSSATVVARLEEAGGIMVAKTTTPEFAFGDETTDGAVNPWGRDRWTGGSSSGSAVALASRQVPLAVGTDTGGSIRVPASYCGVSGLKPTFGRVPRGGVFPVSWTLDHVGPMARSVSDVALMLAVMAGPNSRDPDSSDRSIPEYPGGRLDSLRGIRIGVPDGWLASGCTRGVIDARDEALKVLEGLGAEIKPVVVPNAELACTIAWVITVVEFAAHHNERLDRVEDFTPMAAQRLVAGARTSAVDYLKALRSRDLVQRGFERVFADVDVIMTPGTPSAAPTTADFFDDGDRLWLDKVARNFLPFNVTGMPALVVPTGFDEGLPVSAQVVAPPHADALCLRVGAALQLATSHHESRPS